MHLQSMALLAPARSNSIMFHKRCRNIEEIFTKPSEKRKDLGSEISKTGSCQLKVDENFEFVTGLI